MSWGLGGDELAGVRVDVVEVVVVVVVVVVGVRRLLYLKAEGSERKERLQYLRQTWKSSIWSEEDDDSYTLPDPGIPLVYSLHYGQQCPPEWDDGSVPAETADRQKKKENGKSNLHAEEDFLQKVESLNLDPRLKKLLLTYEEVFGALPPPSLVKNWSRWTSN